MKAYFFNWDVNALKLMNDARAAANYPGGHATGDKLMKEISQEITALLKEENVAGITARFGGDEFGGLLNFKSMEQAKAFQGRLNQRVAKRVETHINEQAAILESEMLQLKNAKKVTDLPPHYRPNINAKGPEAFEAERTRIELEIRKAQFRNAKDRPSLSTGIGEVSEGLRTEAGANPGEAQKLLDHLARETDRVMMQNKADYKLANGLPIDRGDVNLAYAEKPYVPPEPAVIQFKRKP